MMRNISFALTEPQFLDGTKDVTRRTGWTFLKPGDRLRAVRKAMGLKKGEKVHVLGVIEIVSVRCEPLLNICREMGGTSREGFPEMTGLDFIRFFCASHKHCTPETIVTRIEFRRVSDA
ncbi:MAG: hypothetical protein LCH38_11000 [Proteobacteria bacterium]|nr:hypothetical protein [Pseudomonadota bacterium]